MNGIVDKLDMIIAQNNVLEAQSEKIITMLEYITELTKLAK